MSKLKTVIVALLIVAVLIVMNIPVFIMDVDDSSPDYSDLMPLRPEVAPEDNAYTYFSEADALVVLGSDLDMLDFKRGKSFETNRIEQIIADNIDVIKVIEEGLKCAVCLAPEISFNDPDSFPNISDQVSIMNLLSTKVRYERLMGNYSSAVATTVLYLEYVNMRNEFPDSLVSFLVGAGIANSVLYQVSGLVRDSGVSDQQLCRLAEALEEFGDFDESFIYGIRAEFKAMVAFLESSPRFKFIDFSYYVSGNIPDFLLKLPLPGYMFDSNETKEFTAQTHRNVISNAILPFAQMNLLEESNESYDIMDIFLHPNILGKSFSEITSPETYITPMLRLKVSHGALRLLIALERYERAHGTLPAVLALLAPEYIDVVPTDPYDGKPFRYASQKDIEFVCSGTKSKESIVMTGIVYSVGEDLIDQGGSTKTRSKPRAYWRRDGEDLVYGIDEVIETEWIK